MKRPSRKILDQIGIVLLVCGVVMGMGVSSVRGLATWVMILVLALGLVCVAAGLWLSRAFRRIGSDREQDGRM